MEPLHPVVIPVDRELHFIITPTWTNVRMVENHIVQRADMIRRNAHTRHELDTALHGWLQWQRYYNARITVDYRRYGG